MPRYDEVPCLLALTKMSGSLASAILIQSVEDFTTNFLQNAEMVEVIDNDMRLRIACVRHMLLMH